MNSRPPDFDLLTERWICAWSADGAPVEIGVLDALRCAPLLSRIADPSPLVTFGTHRLLAAVLHQHLRVSDEEGWAELWEAGQFPGELLAEIEARCGGRLRLFDAEHPFYQSADLPLDCKPIETLKSVGYLAPEASTGTNIAHFSHAGEARHAFCPACCAKGLVQLPCFATAGGAGIKPGINGVPPLYLLPRGDNLFQTLLLNFLLPAYRGGLARGPDPGPLWESAATVAAKSERSSAGFVESLTWPPRRVRLYPDKGGICSRCGQGASTLVRRIVFAQGWSRDRSLPPWRDAWVAYERRKARGADQPDLLPLRPSEQGDAWRDFPSLFLEHDTEAVRPRVLDQIGSLKGDYLPPESPITCELFGLRTDMKAKIFEWRQDSFTFPRRLLRSPLAAEAMRDALAYADDAAFAIRCALKEINATMANPRDPVTGMTLRRYWQALEASFRQKLGEVHLAGDLAARSIWLAEWRQTARRTAGCELEAALGNLDSDAKQLQRQVRARSTFHAVLARKEGGRS